MGASSDPASITRKAEAERVLQTPDQLIDPRTGKLGTDPQGRVTAASVAPDAEVEADLEGATYTADEVAAKVKAALQDFSGAQGEVSNDTIVAAITKDPTLLAQLGLSPEQIGAAVRVEDTDPATLQPDQLVAGDAVDWAKVEEQAQVEAVTADPSKKATVAGQLEGLMSDFEGGETPPWAAGAMRTAMAKMQARGLGASSIAGQAVVQAAMESALPIAMQDAQTFAKFESQNLSNRQQAAMFAAQQRAGFLQLEFTQNFQAKVANASRVADIADMNFTAEQQVALENARLAQSVDLANLNSRQAKMMADAAAMSQMDLANLSHMQQAAVANAQSFLQMDLANLSNSQQDIMFKQQAINSSILSDQAAENASLQFNASSQNQTDQFMANLQANMAQFNAAQRNAISQFNAGEANAMEKLNVEVRNQRDQFEATRSLEIAQSNVQWRRNVATADAAAQNASNLEFARSANGFTQTTLDNLWQRERDLMAFAFQQSESTEERNLQLLLADKQIDAEASTRRSEGIGYLVGSLLFG